MNAQQIGSVTGLLSIGGLITALFAGNIAGVFGRRKASILTCIPFVIGSLLTGSAQTVWQLQIGRFVEGLGAGAAIVIVPLYLSEIGPAHLRGMLGFMSQVSINIGILLAQILGIFFSTYSKWRLILFFGAVIGAAYATLLILFIQETPVWLASSGQIGSARKTLQYLRDNEDVEDEFKDIGGEISQVVPSSIAESISQDEDQALLSTEPSASSNMFPAETSSTENIVSVSSFVFSPRYRSQLIVVCGIMIAQQFCGVNSIIFYGVSVLANLFPELTKEINCFISILNCVVTMYSSTIVDKYGRKRMLITSIAGMAVAAFLLGFGINNALPTLSAVAATLFVFAFAIGLGPIPFMIISELVSHNAVGAAQSVGTTANWLATFVVGYSFPILRVKLEGYTYYLFVVFCLISVVFVITFVPASVDQGTKEGKYSVREASDNQEDTVSNV